MEDQEKKYKRVMVVDDTYVDRFIAEKNIIKYNYAEEVLLMDSAQAALDCLASLVNTPELIPEVIFLDIRMPEIDGFGFLEEYEKLSTLIKNKCVIMMLSTSLYPGDHEKVKNNGHVKGFVNKPLRKEVISSLKDTVS